MKMIKVGYTFEVTKLVGIDDETPPEPYTEEGYEDQQIQNVGDDIEFSLDGQINWHFQRLD